MNALSRVLLLALRAYQFLLSPWIGGSCRYWPSCSEYSAEAIRRFGALRGIWLTAARLGRCHPYAQGGVDPVPARFQWRCRCAVDGKAPHAPGQFRTH
jgi:putative membrane protein insertion efficiency factor